MQYTVANKQYTLAYLREWFELLMSEMDDPDLSCEYEQELVTYMEKIQDAVGEDTIEQWVMES